MDEGALPFDVSISDPKQRLEAYLDRWRKAKEYNVSRRTQIDHRNSV